MAKHSLYTLPEFSVQFVTATVVDVLGKVETEVINSGELAAQFLESFRASSMNKADLAALDVTLARIFTRDSIIPDFSQMNITLDGMEFWFTKE